MSDHELLEMAQLVSETANLARLTFPSANKRATAADEGKERAAASWLLAGFLPSLECKALPTAVALSAAAYRNHNAS